VRRTLLSRRLPHLAESLGKRSDVIGLGKKTSPRWQVIRGNMRMAGGNDQLDGGPAIANGVRQPESIHRTRHLDVGEYQTHVSARFEYGDRLVRSGGRERLEASFRCNGDCR